MSQKNLPAQRAKPQTKEELTALMRPVSELSEPQEEAQNAALISTELDFLAYKLNRWGWEDKDRAAYRERATQDWVQKLRGYPVGEVKRAIGDYLDWRADRVAKGKKINPDFPTESDIANRVQTRRKQAFHRLPKPIPQQSPTSEVSAEDKAHRAKVAAEMMARFKSD